jgi:GTP-binding protein HflX
VGEQIVAVNAVLEEIGAAGKPTLMVFNKTDRLGSSELLSQYLERFPNGVGISAKAGDGIPALLQELGAMLRPVRELVALSIPHHEAAVIARLHASAQVLDRDYAGPQARFRARIPPHLRSEFEGFIQEEGW